jgi:hypothetical protein
MCLALKVARREDARRRSGEEAVSRRFEEDRWQKLGDLANSGVRRLRAQGLGAQSR